MLLALDQSAHGGIQSPLTIPDLIPRHSALQYIFTSSVLDAEDKAVNNFTDNPCSLGGLCSSY
jgi:hypothetical protein